MTFFCFLSYKYKYGTRKNLLPFVLKMLNSATTFSMKSGFFEGYKGGYSFFSSTAGFVLAAFCVCQSTARKEMNRAMTAPTMNTHS